MARRTSPTAPVIAEPGKVYRVGTKKVTKAVINRLRWERGDLFSLVRPHQEVVYRAIWNTPPHGMQIILCHRQFGKTHTVQTVADEKARKKTNWIGVLFSPQKAQGRLNVLGNFEHLYSTCPVDLRPKDYIESEGCLIWPNGSRLYIAGTDDSDQRERLRGQHADDVFIDEAASHKELKYLLRSIVRPMTDTTGGRIFLITTLPKHPDHEFMEFHDRAERLGQLVRATIDSNTFYTEATKRRICSEVNSEFTDAEQEQIYLGKRPGNTDWEREYKLEMVADSNLRVCPEFKRESHTAEQLERPEFVDRYVFMDQGHAPDFFAILFAEYDFSTTKLRVLAEWLGRHKNTDEIVVAAQDIERELWPRLTEPPRRFADDPRGKQQLRDMASAPRLYYVSEASKSPGDEEQSRAVRYRTHAGHIQVAARCKNLIAQMAGGVFRSKEGSKVEFERSKSHGHLDAFSALAVGVRSVNWNHNAIPPGVSQGNPHMFVARPAEKQTTPLVKKMIRLFRGANGAF